MSAHHFRVRTLLLVSSVVSLLLPRLASAETAVILPAGGDDALASQRGDAQRVLSQALAAQAVQVIPHAEAVAKVGGGAAAECASVDCAPSLLQASGADVAVAVAVWGAGQPAKPATVYVTLVDRHGNRYPGKTRVEGDDLAAATKQALLEARALQLLGPGPWLRVRGKPDGAEVLLDGKLVGSVPYRAPLSSGRHTLEVRFEGKRPLVQSVDVPPNAARQIDIEVDLGGDGGETRAPGAGGVAVEASEPPPPGRPLVGPLVLGGVGVVLVASDLAFLASKGCSARDAQGVCYKSSRTNVAPAVIWGAVGAGAITAAVLWYVLSAPPAQEDGVSLRVGPTEATLRLTF